MNDSSHPLVDARGLNCPLPLLKLKKALATNPGAARYTLLATDPDSEVDIRRLAVRAGYELVVSRDDDGAQRFVLTPPD